MNSTNFVTETCAKILAGICFASPNPHGQAAGLYLVVLSAAHVI